MTAHDLDAVQALEARLQTHPWTRGNFADALAAGNWAWVVRAHGGVIAYAVLLAAADEVELLVLGVAPEHQRRGVGRALLEHACQAARRAGKARLLLEVRVSNTAARAFYARLGFHEIGRRRGYYQAATGREDALLMAKMP